MTEAWQDDDEELDLVDPFIGMELGGRYRVVKKIGVGGMGSVYEAEHTGLGKRFAIKILHPQYASDPHVVRRFRNEGKAASRLKNQHIVECSDFDRTPDGSPFLVMEYLEGRPLSDELTEHGAMSVGRAARIGAQLASALAAAHEQKIVHRDVKPENVFLCDRPGGADHVKVVDFGISKFDGQLSAATRTGAVLGSPFYMAPEQVQDASKADARTDIYAVGAVLYQMLTGQLPFTAKSFPMLVVKITTEMPDPIEKFRGDVPQPLIELIEQAMAKLPDDRVPDMKTLHERLMPFFGMNEAPQKLAVPAAYAETAPSNPTVTPFSTAGTMGGGTLPTRGHGLAMTLGGAGLLAIGIAVGFGLLGTGGDDPPRERAPTPESTTSTTMASATGGTPDRGDFAAPIANVTPTAAPSAPAVADAGPSTVQTVAAESRRPGRGPRNARAVRGPHRAAPPDTFDALSGLDGLGIGGGGRPGPTGRMTMAPAAPPPPRQAPPTMTEMRSSTMQVGGVPINEDDPF